MKCLLVLGALAATVIVPAATAAPSAAGTIRGTIVAKDRGHRALDVRGAVTAVSPATADAAGSITVAVRGLPVSCAIPGVSFSTCRSET